MYKGALSMKSGSFELFYYPLSPFSPVTKKSSITTEILSPMAVKPKTIVHSLKYTAQAIQY